MHCTSYYYSILCLSNYKPSTLKFTKVFWEYLCEYANYSLYLTDDSYFFVTHYFVTQQPPVYWIFVSVLPASPNYWDVARVKAEATRDYFVKQVNWKWRRDDCMQNWEVQYSFIPGRGNTQIFDLQQVIQCEKKKVHLFV